MNRCETILLFLSGREAWNAWVGEKLAERKAMERDGRWSAACNWRGEVEPLNDETRAWLESCKADFSHCFLSIKNKNDHASDEEVTTRCDDTAGKKLVEISGDRIDFGDYIFPGEVLFYSANFSGATRFEGTSFCSTAHFGGAMCPSENMLMALNQL